MLRFSCLTRVTVLACFAVSLNEAVPRTFFSNNAGLRDTDLGIVEDFECPPGKGIAPHPELCQYYYTCYSNITHLWKCSGELVFDLVYDGCNYLYLTDCGSRIPPFTCPADGLYPLQPEACDPRYFKCENGNYTIETCPSGVFDTSSYSCSGTELCLAKTTTTAIPRSTPGEFVCPEPDGQFPSPWDCTQFYTCISGTPFLFTCPADLYYNPSIHACDFPENVPECNAFW